MENRVSPFILVDWNFEHLSEDFQQPSPVIPKMVEKDNIKYLAINLKNLDQYIELKEQKIISEKWLPKLKDSSLDTLAILVPEKVIGQIAVRSVFGGELSEDFKIVFWDDWVANAEPHPES